MKMKKTVSTAVGLTLVLIAVLTGKAYAEPLATWSPVDWGVVDNEIDDPKNTGENINVSTGVSIEVPAETLEKLAGKKTTLAFLTGTGIAISASGWEMKAPGYDLNILITDEEDVIPGNIVQSAAGNALYSRIFSMEEKTDYGIRLNIHLKAGEEFAGKHANLYCYDEQSGQLVCQGSFLVTKEGMAMFALPRGDEYLLTVTEKLPAGGRLAYTVADGDCLSRIASRSGVSLKSLLASNPQITDADLIHPGDRITIVKQ